MHYLLRALPLTFVAALALVARPAPWTAAAPPAAKPDVLYWTRTTNSAPKKQTQFNVPAGFRVETVVAPGTSISGKQYTKASVSFVNVCFDAGGRLFLSQEKGPVVLCLEPDNAGAFQKLLPFCEQVTNCQGMCWAHDALYLVGNGPKGPGLYRCRDTKKHDRIDSVELLLKSRRPMGEHGPHAVIHGPDDKLYVAFGNHAWAEIDKLAVNSPLTRWPDGAPGPDQGNLNTREDVLLPRQNDPHGHGANTLAPGGTIWRVDLDGKNPALVAAGFRNHFDIAFHPDGELFTFDSDMEGDEGLPWYRPVRVCHCPPGGDFLWRIGSANTPPHYLDSLPPVVETGRGSPTGVECYDHDAFPARYRGALFLGDWSIGVIWAVHLQRDGASYKSKGQIEKFCAGAPMPVTDCAVGKDGALYFAVGGRGAQGGVYRIVYDRASEVNTKAELADGVQPLASWSQPRRANASAERLIRSPEGAAARRAREILLLSFRGGADADELLAKALADEDSLVRRRACEAYVRLGILPPLADLSPLLGDRDRFVRTAARLALQQIDSSKWANRLLRDPDDRVALAAIAALCKVDKAEQHASKIFQRLHDKTPERTEQLLDWLRVIQLALVHTKERPGAIRGIALDCLERFPHEDRFVNRELAILLAEFARSKVLTEGVAAKLVDALKASDDRQQQIHYFYCLRLVKDDWSAAHKRELLAWYETTATWTGGPSFGGYLQNILRDASDLWSAGERKELIGKIGQIPATATALIGAAAPDDLPEPRRLHEMLRGIDPSQARAEELKTVIVEAVSRSRSAGASAVLRQIADSDPSVKTAAIRLLARQPDPVNLPYLLQGLEAVRGPSEAGATLEFLEAIRKNPGKPKPDDAAAIRRVLLASGKLSPDQKWKAVQVLRQWTSGKSFGAESDKEWKSELAAWGRWYAQSFPKEPALPDVTLEQPAESKYMYAELLKYLQSDPRGTKGDAARGKLAFAKASCVKCHKFGPEGEAIGPDLSAVAKRFKRSEILESVMNPSKVISDQYRSSQVSLLDGRIFIGLAAEMGESVTILLNDGSKVTVKKSDIESKIASLVSVMPEKLLDELTKEEIADLFAFLESAAGDKK